MTLDILMSGMSGFDVLDARARKRGPIDALLDGSALRGRRRGRSVILFSTDGAGPTATAGVGMPVFGVARAVEALRSALGADVSTAEGR